MNAVHATRHAVPPFPHPLSLSLSGLASLCLPVSLPLPLSLSLASTSTQYQLTPTHAHIALLQQSAAHQLHIKPSTHTLDPVSIHSLIPTSCTTAHKVWLSCLDGGMGVCGLACLKQLAQSYVCLCTVSDIIIITAYSSRVSPSVTTTTLVLWPSCSLFWSLTECCCVHR